MKKTWSKKSRNTVPLNLLFSGPCPCCPVPLLGSLEFPQYVSSSWNMLPGSLNLYSGPWNIGASSVREQKWTKVRLIDLQIQFKFLNVSDNTIGRFQVPIVFRLHWSIFNSDSLIDQSTCYIQIFSLDWLYSGPCVGTTFWSTQFFQHFPILMCVS